MSDSVTFPYIFEAAFFSSLNFRRTKQLPSHMEMPINVQTKLLEPEFPRLQINIKVNTPKGHPLEFEIELVGMFKYVGENSNYDDDLNNKFLFERAFHMLWPNISQLVRIITGQMGMNPLDIQVPIDLKLQESTIAEKNENNAIEE